MTLSSGSGPVLSLAVFYYLGNEWTVANCQLVVLIGVGCMMPALLMMCFFDDNKALTHHSEAMVPLLSDDHSEDMTGNIEDVGVGAGAGDALGDCTGDSSISRWMCSSPSVAVPLLLTSSDFLAALASGMTIKFFSLFFMEKILFSPAAVSLLSVVAPLGVSGASLLAQKCSKIIGRVQTSIITRIIDIILLVLMAKLPITPGLATRALVAMHLLRMAAANCTRPLMRSVLNQFVPKRHRGKISALDSVRTFSWSGSAALGGILVERIGFEGTFLVTAMIKVGALLPLPFMLSHVPDGVFGGGKRALRCQDVTPEGLINRS